MKLSELNSYSKAQIRKLSTFMLEQCITKARDIYYGSGKTRLEDLKYDELEDELRSRDPKHVLLKTVGGANVKGRKKVKLPYPLFSLAKIKPSMPNEFARWLAKHPGPYVISNKEDGMSLELIYGKKVAKGYTLSAVYTRGTDGVIGQDVSHLIPHLKVQKTTPREMAVRAEVSMKESAFKAHFEDKGYVTARNLVAGMVNRLKGDHSLIGHAEVIAYEIISPRMTTSASFKKLEALGFKVAPYRVAKSITFDSLTKIFQKARSSSKRLIDGLVVEQDAINKRPKAGAHSPTYAFAFKSQDEDDSAVVKILNIDWEESKHGKMQPVIEIPPTKLAGVTVNNVSGHNAFFIVHGYRSKEVPKARRAGTKLTIKPLGKGATIRIVRSGDVIPHVVEVIKGAAKPGLPKIAYSWDANKVNILMDVKSDLVRDKRITAFFSELEVDGVKLGVVQKLTEAGYTTIIKILRATADDFMEIPGFKRRSAEKLAASIRAKCTEAPLNLLMAGSGNFGAGFGSRRFEAIIKAYPRLLTSWEKLTPAQIKAKVMAIEGFQEKTATVFAAGFHKFTKWLRISKIKPVMPKAVKPTGTKFKGEAVCFTGFRDKSLEAEIIKQGGTIVSGVSKNTTILVYAEGKASSKIAKAESLGLKTYTADQLRKRLKV